MSVVVLEFIMGAFCGGQCGILVRVKGVEKLRANRGFQTFQIFLSIAVDVTMKWQKSKREEGK